MLNEEDVVPQQRFRAIARLAVGAGLTVASLVTMTGVSGAEQDRPPKVTNGPCKYTETPDDPAARKVPLPRDPHHTPDTGTVTVRIDTSHGPLDLTLDRSKAPCTVQSFIHLAKHRFYDQTICHRLTAYPTLKVLQCGDPSGTGELGPGYKYKDELPTNLPPAPTDPTGARRVYARGVLAMANAGPDTNGSQFFLVYADSTLPPDYTVFGTIDEAGLATVDKVAAEGTDDSNGPGDGKPKTPVTIQTATVAA